MESNYSFFTWPPPDAQGASDPISDENDDMLDFMDMTGYDGDLDVLQPVDQGIATASHIPPFQQQPPAGQPLNASDALPEFTRSNRHIRLPLDHPISFQPVVIGTGADAGSNLMALFGVEETPRTRWYLLVQEGRKGRDAWSKYPSSTMPIPPGLTLAEICRGYPNHVWGTGLRLFESEGWKAKQIFDHLPVDARNQGAPSRPWNYLQARLLREKKNLYQEQTGLKWNPVPKSLGTMPAMQQQPAPINQHEPQPTGPPTEQQRRHRIHHARPVPLDVLLRPFDNASQDVPAARYEQFPSQGLLAEQFPLQPLEAEQFPPQRPYPDPLLSQPQPLGYPFQPERFPQQPPHPAPFSSPDLIHQQPLEDPFLSPVILQPHEDPIRTERFPQRPPYPYRGALTVQRRNPMRTHGGHRSRVVRPEESQY